MNNAFDAYTEEVAAEALQLARNVIAFVEARMA
jgi:HEPN domain-containing protein